MHTTDPAGDGPTDSMGDDQNQADAAARTPPPQQREKGPDIRATKLPGGHMALIPQTFDECWRVATVMARGKLVPKDYWDDPSSVMSAIMWGMELGMSPSQAVQGIAIINGRPSIWGDAMLALVIVAPVYEWHRETPLDKDLQPMKKGQDGVFGYRCEVKRKGLEPDEVVFTLDDARRARLYPTKKGGPWDDYTPRMLKMRARGWAFRDNFADVLRGMAMTEEVRDAIEGEFSVVDDTKRPQGETKAAVRDPIRAPQRKKAAEPETPAASVDVEKPEVPAIGHQATDELLQPQLALADAERVVVDGYLVNATTGEVLAKATNGLPLEPVTPGLVSVLTAQADQERAKPSGGSKAPPASGSTNAPPLGERTPLSDGGRLMLERELANHPMTTMQDVIDQVGDVVHAGNLQQAMRWLRSRDDV